MEQPDSTRESSDDTIEVLVVAPTASVETISDQSLRSRFTLPGDTHVTLPLPTEILGHVVAEVSRQVDAVMAHVEDTQQHVQLDQISVAVALSATGGIQWVMNLTGAVQGTLSLTFKVKHGQAAATPPISS